MARTEGKEELERRRSKIRRAGVNRGVLDTTVNFDTGESKTVSDLIEVPEVPTKASFTPLDFNGRNPVTQVLDWGAFVNEVTPDGKQTFTRKPTQKVVKRQPVTAHSNSPGCCCNICCQANPITIKVVIEQSGFHDLLQGSDGSQRWERVKKAAAKRATDRKPGRGIEEARTKRTEGKEELRQRRLRIAAMKRGTVTTDKPVVEPSAPPSKPAVRQAFAGKPAARSRSGGLVMKASMKRRGSGL